MCLALAAGLIYSNIYATPFSFDSIDVIEKMEDLRDFSYFKSFDRLLVSRNVVWLTFALNYHFDELNVFGYHLVNVLIHILNGFLVYLLALVVFRRLARFSDPARSMLALSSALLYACHPLQTMAVTYTVQRLAAMAALFFILSVLCYLKAREIAGKTKKREKQGNRLSPLAMYFAAFLSGLLAILCKLNAASLPGVILMCEYLCFSRSWKTWKKKIPIVLIIGIVWVLLVLQVGAFFKTVSDGDGFIESISNRSRSTALVSRWAYLCTQFKVITIYIRLMVFPVGLNLDYLYPFNKGFWEGWTPLGFLFLASIAALGFKSIKKHPVIAFGIGWFFITLSVESSVLPIIDALYEHRVYLPLVGFSLIVPYLLLTFLPGKKLRTAVIVCLVLVISAGTATYLRNFTWKDNFTLWSDVIAKAPHNARAHYNIGIEYTSRGEPEMAITHYRKAIELNPDLEHPYYNLGKVLAERDQNKEAVSLLQKAVEIKPDYAQAHNNLGSALFKMGRKNDALAAYTRAVEINGEFVEAIKNLGNAYAKVGQTVKAIQTLERAVAIDETFAEAWYLLGNLYMTEKKNDLAMEVYLKAIDHGWSSPVIYSNLGVLYLSGGDLDRAESNFQQAVQLDPRYADAFFNWGIVKLKKGDRAGALALYEKTLAIKSGFKAAHDSIVNIYILEKKYDLAVKQCEEARGHGVSINPWLLNQIKP